MVPHEYAPPAVEEDGFDFMELALFFWDRRVTIGAITGAFLVWGILIALLSPVEYQASGTFLPESQSGQSLGSTLVRQYGGLLGLGEQAGGGGLSPSLYPDIIESVPFQVELMNVPITFASLDTTVTAHQYFRDLHPTPKTTYLWRYTFELPWTVWGWIRSGLAAVFSGSGGSETSSVSPGPSPVLQKINRDTVLSLNSQQKSTLSRLRSRLTVAQAGMLISLTAEFPDSRAAAEIGQAGIDILKQYVSEYRTQKALEELQFVREQMEEARKNFEAAQKRLAEFRDSNVNIATAMAQTKEQQLQSEYDLRFNIYNSLAQNLEQAKLRVQEETPVFTTVEPFQVPDGSSKPDTRLIIALYLVAGFIVSCLWVLLKRQWDQFRSFITSGGQL